MEKGNSLIYEKGTLEFVTVALEFCSFVENPATLSQPAFTDKATKLLPLLYLKAALLPDWEEEEDVYLEMTVTEDMYESVRNRIAGILGGKDGYLDTFHPDMPYSDTPVAAFISENLADVYQDLANFLFLFRQGYEEVMQAATVLCKIGFREYWGQQLLNALKALHTVRYGEEMDPDKNDNEE